MRFGGFEGDGTEVAEASIPTVRFVLRSDRGEDGLDHIFQPTTLRDRRSMTTARCSQPSPGRMAVVSATQTWLVREIPLTAKARRTRLGADKVLAGAPTPRSPGRLDAA